MTTINLEQKVNLIVKALTAQGNPASLDGAPLWTSSNLNAVTLEVAQDGYSAYAIANGIGTSTITVAGDADLTAGVSQITASVDISVIAAPAASLSITPSAPISK